MLAGDSGRPAAAGSAGHSGYSALRLKTPVLEMFSGDAPALSARYLVVMQVVPPGPPPTTTHR